MREVAVVSFAQSPCVAANRRDDMAEILLPVIRTALDAAGIGREEVGFFASGSHDFYEGRTFAYIESLDAVGAWPPISESHVEMDAAWAFYEAWAWLQLGEGDIALVYGIGRGSLAMDLDQVMPAQLDPYFLAPLRPHRDAIAALQACALIAAGHTSEREMAAVVTRSLTAAAANPFAQLTAASSTASQGAVVNADPFGLLAASATADPGSRRPEFVTVGDPFAGSADPGIADVLRAAAGSPGAQGMGSPAVEALLAMPYVASPLRAHDVAPVGDAAAVVVLAAGETARRLARRPAWVRGMDHRMDTHYPGMRDLTRAESVRIAGERAARQAGFAASDVDVAELHTEYSYQEPLLAKTLGLHRALVNPSGGPLAGRPMTATGLVRLGEAARSILEGTANRALAHATSGPALQQNLICLFEGDR